MTGNGVTDRDKGREKWSTLRNAFISAVAASKVGGAESNGERERQMRGRSAKLAPATIILARFQGFALFPRHEEDLPSSSAAASAASAQRNAGHLVLATYELPGGKKVVTREAPCDRQGSRGGVGRVVTLDQLFAHRIHGVDNTGNVRVWPAEQVLLQVLLSGPLASSLVGMRVLELGAGMSGLAGLGVAACSSAAEVVITDGNPDALENLTTCVELNAAEGVFGDTKVVARRLMWDSLDKIGDRAALLRPGSSPGGCSAGGGQFDLIVASDCLFFKDFHEDLIDTIGGLLKPSGRAVLVQPQRGGTVNLFLQRVAAGAAAAEGQAKMSLDRSAGAPVGACERRIEARLLDRYDNQIWKMHLEFLHGSSGRNGGSTSPPSAKGPSSPALLSLSSSRAAAAAAAAVPASEKPAYVPDEHQPLLVEMVIRAREEGAGRSAPETSGARLCEPPPLPLPPIRQKKHGQQPWIAWPRPGSPITAPGYDATVSPTVLDSRGQDKQGDDNGRGDGAATAPACSP